MRCSMCGTEFSYPEHATDKAFGKLIGGIPGCTCDDCSEIVVNGSQEELQRLLDNRPNK